VLDERGSAILLEVVVATFLLSLAIIPIFFGLTAVLVSMEQSTGVTAATGHLQDQAELVKAAGYDYIPLGVLIVGDNPGEICYGTPFIIVQQTTQWQLMTTNPDGIGTSVVKKVVLSVYRRPYTYTDSGTEVPLARWEFLLYASGV